MTNRERGDYFERSTRAALESTGWVTVRSAGSFGPADVWAARAGTLLLLSCKVDGRMRPGERDDLMRAAEQAGGIPVVSYRPPDQSRGWVGLAIVDGTPSPVLWDVLKVPPKPKPEPKPGPDDEGP